MKQSNINSTSQPILQQQYMNNVPQVPLTYGFKCQYHPTFLVTNVCMEKSCIQPLCPQCIQKHVAAHQGMSPQICTLQVMQDSVVQDTMNIEKKLIELTKYKVYIVQNLSVDALANIKSKIENSRRIILGCINEFFDQFNQEVTCLVQQQNDKNFNELQLLEKTLKDRLQAIQKIQSKLGTDSGLEKIIQFYQNSTSEENYDFLFDCKKYLESFVQNSFFDITLNQEAIHSIKIDLSKFISLNKQLQTYKSYDEVTADTELVLPQNENELQFMSVKQQLNLPKQQFMTQYRSPISNNNFKSNILISQPLTTNPILNSAQNKISKIHTLPIEETSTQPKQNVNQFQSPLQSRAQPIFNQKDEEKNTNTKQLERNLSNHDYFLTDNKKKTQ